MTESAIFTAALEKATPEERAAYVQDACGGDASLRRRVEVLLAAHDAPQELLPPQIGLPSPQKPGFFEKPGFWDAPIAEAPGTAIGSYKLLEQLGEGGFGVVFLAEQTEPVRRKVALKVLKPGMDTSQVVARFEAERQALAIMDHPNIAKVFDGGATASGRPFFVMELVQGVPITAYCDEHQLTQKQRLDLFLSVCRAVQHAHQKGVIHRDLKPSNILVCGEEVSGGVVSGKLGPPHQSPLTTPYSPTVKVIDFGVAKALGGQLTEKTVFTAASQMIGTPLYMSPEQAGGTGLDVDTRSDIYSLGAVLYELLTGATPIAKARLKQASFAEIQRIIRDDEPPKPSSRIRKDEAIRRFRRFHRFSIHNLRNRRNLRIQELDWIVMKCLEKDRNRRYETVNGLARDIERYLADEPVEAQPPSAMYRLRKFVRRNRVRVTTAAVMLVALIVAGISHQMRLEQTRRATRAATLVQALKEADLPGVPRLLADLEEYRPLADPLLRQMAASANLDSPERLRVALALLPVDDTQVEYLFGRIPDATPQELLVISNGLKPYRARLTGRLWEMVEDTHSEAAKRFRAAGALAVLDPENPKWTHAAGDAVAWWVVENDVFLDPWMRLLEPVATKLLPALIARFRQVFPANVTADERTELRHQRRIVATIIAQFAAEQPDVLTDILADADLREFEILFPKLAKHRLAANSYLEAELQQAPPRDATIDAIAHLPLTTYSRWYAQWFNGLYPTDNELDQSAQRHANAAVALLRLPGAPGEKAWPIFQHRPDPSARTWLIHRVQPLGISPDLLLERFEQESDVSARRALLLALGEYDPQSLAARGVAQRFLPQLLALYRDCPDAGLHGAAGWLLGQWKHEGDRAAIDQELATRKLEGQRQWYVTKQGQTMVVIPGPVEFVMGQLDEIPGHVNQCSIHRQRIGRTFAMQSKPVTFREYSKFRPELDPSTYWAPTMDCPAAVINWYNAAEYCNWLSEQEGIPKDQWCYIPNGQGKYDAGMELAPNYLELEGYRLPTSAEYEYACRAGAITSRYYGRAEALLSKYAWHYENSDSHSHPVGVLRPNDFGLFDMHGNVWSWCSDEPPFPKTYESHTWERIFVFEADTAANSAALSADVAGLIGAVRCWWMPAPEERRPIDFLREDITFVRTNLGSYYRSVRGGSVGNRPRDIRCALRNGYPLTAKNYGLGMRLARTLSAHYKD